MGVTLKKPQTGEKGEGFFPLDTIYPTSKATEDHMSGEKSRKPLIPEYFSYKSF